MTNTQFTTHMSEISKSNRGKEEPEPDATSPSLRPAFAQQRVSVPFAAAAADVGITVNPCMGWNRAGESSEHASHPVLDEENVAKGFFSARHSISPDSQPHS